MTKCCLLKSKNKRHILPPALSCCGHPLPCTIWQAPVALCHFSVRLTSSYVALKFGSQPSLLLSLPRVFPNRSSSPFCHLIVFEPVWFRAAKGGHGTIVWDQNFKFLILPSADFQCNQTLTPTNLLLSVPSVFTAGYSLITLGTVKNMFNVAFSQILGLKMYFRCAGSLFPVCCFLFIWN